MRGTSVSQKRVLALALTIMPAGLACTGVVAEPGSQPGTTGTGNRPGGGTGTGGNPGIGGTIGGGLGGSGADPFAAACASSNGVLNAGVTPLRLLTRDQYNNTARDLLGA